MATQATRDKLGNLAVAQNNLFDKAKTGVRDIDEVTQYVQAIADGQFNLSVRSSAPSEFGPILTPSGFTPVALQVAQFELWNKELGLGRSDKEIHEAMLAAPDFDWSNPNIGATLCWTQDTLCSTIASQLAVMRTMVYGLDKVYVSDNFRLTSDHLYLPEGAPEFTPNRLWWEIMDFNGNRGKAPDQVPVGTAANTQLFSAACQHKTYVLGQNGNGRPYWNVGLGVSVPGESEAYAPFINGLSDGLVNVNVDWADNAHPNYSGPVVL